MVDISRRDLIAAAGAALATSGFAAGRDDLKVSADRAEPSAEQNNSEERRSGSYLDHIAFPLGGMGAGMICLQGAGALSNLSIRHAPDIGSEAPMFAAVSVRQTGFARVLEGPVPAHKRFPSFSLQSDAALRSFWGLPRFRRASFRSSFPFADIILADDDSPLDVTITAWSPFEPGKEDDASLPVAGLEYRFVNRTGKPIEAVFSFNAGNMMAGEKTGGIRSLAGGFILEGAIEDRPWTAGAFAVSTDDDAVEINHAWFRGFAYRHVLWKDIAEGACYSRPPLSEASGEPVPGATLFVPFALAAGEEKLIRIRLGWYVPDSNLRLSGGGSPDFDWRKRHDTAHPGEGLPCYKPWYAGRYAGIEPLMADWSKRYQDLRIASERFSRTFFAATLPVEVIEAVAANLSILKSPTVLRQVDGKFWAWEGSRDHVGSCEGSCTHVWNYAQALPHLFPRLERTLRAAEFGPNQDEHGHQAFRSAMPIGPAPHDFVAAADGQLGGIMKIYRDWRISGDTDWLREIWPKVRASLDYCIRTWDPRMRGWLEEPHHNTYDSELWGPDGMCTSIYLGALKAATLIGGALGSDTREYATLLTRGVRRLERELFNGEYFYQKISLNGLSAKYPEDFGKGAFPMPLPPEELAIAAREGPSFQYGTGCMADGAIGAWMAWACGLEAPIDRRKVVSHLEAVHRYNFKNDLTAHANPTFSSARATYALADEAGLLLCTWPKGGTLSLPFPYATEIWTGVEYQVAAHLISLDRVDQGLEIVRACRARYDGRRRNPFSEVEAGHWYSRAMASYALLQACSGARYDAVEKILYLHPRMAGDFRSFLATETGYGTVGVANGQPFVEIASGTIPYQRIDYRAA
ncbi:MAG TPA: GH116 family glycosyl hydrolase [Steroidobacter sp.]